MFFPKIFLSEFRYQTINNEVLKKIIELVAKLYNVSWFKILIIAHKTSKPFSFTQKMCM